MSPGPYRQAATEFVTAWHDEHAARDGVEALLRRLAERGYVVEETVAYTLGLTARAMVGGEVAPSTRVFVGWELAEKLNQALERLGASERLFRRSETSERWLLTTPDDADARRARGEVLLERPEPVRLDRTALALGCAGLLLLVYGVWALVHHGAWWTVAAWALVIAMVVTATRWLYAGDPKEQPKLALVLSVGVYLPPIVDLSLRGAWPWLAGLLGGMAVYATLERVARRRRRADPG